MLPLFEHIDPIPSPVEVLLKKEFKHTIVRYRKDGIVHVTYMEGRNVTISDLYAMGKFISHIGVANKYKVLSELELGATIDNEARVFLATEAGSMFVSKNAVLCRYIEQEMISNFFIRVDNPKVSTKIFEDKTKAIKWLLSSSLDKISG